MFAQRNVYPHCLNVYLKKEKNQQGVLEEFESVQCIHRFFTHLSPDSFCHLPGRKGRVSNLQSLVCWYQEHAHTCPHEPQLRALEPQPNFSTAAIWECDSDHSFVQYLFSLPREASDSEHEAGMNEEGDGETAAKTDLPVTKGVVSRRRRKEAHKQYKGEE